MEAIGYHGTTSDRGESIQQDGLRPGRGRRPRWLGTGVYFFQDGLKHAENWARFLCTIRPNEKPIVISASIDLSNGLDLADASYWSQIRDLVRIATPPDQKQIDVSGLLSIPPPPNLGINHEDSYYMSLFAAKLQSEGHSVKTIRAAFIEGSPIFPSSWLFDQSHIQICVRDPSAISNIKVHQL